MLEAEAKERQKMAGAKNLENFNSGLVVPTLGGLDKQPRSVEIAAKALGVAHGNISEMKRISNVAPERVEDIKQGKATVTGRQVCG